LRIDHINRPMCARLPEVAADLAEVASYIYAADQATGRGGTKEFEYGESWRRHFRLEIPVRCPKVWRRPEVIAALSETLGFLSDDDYEFGFSKHSAPPSLETYLFDTVAEEGERQFHEVLLFSGGLDSLGGAVQEILQGQRKVALVSHRSNSKIYARQAALVAQLGGCLTDRSLRPLHVAVEVNKGKRLTNDFNQRTRSFLFAALASIVARGFDLRTIRFYENGVLSIHLPISPQLVGSRASRSTHPQVLHGLDELFSAIFDCDFTVENPFLWKTKTDVLTAIKTAGHGRLCAGAISCVHTIEMTTEHGHCGRCSQCLDRRLAALAAGLTPEEDPPEQYATDALTTPREGADLTLIERYLGTVRRIEAMSHPLELTLAYTEISRALRYCHVSANQASQSIFKLYRDHAQQILQGLSRAVKEYSDQVVRQAYPPNCLLSLACGQSLAQRGPPVSVSQTSNVAPGPARLELDPDTFTARWGSHICYFGNTVELRLLERLNRRPGTFVSIEALRAAVWQNEHTEKNTIQRTVSNLRRRLRHAGITGIIIDGSQKDHYCLRNEPGR
jgi:hypothetical protein